MVEQFRGRTFGRLRNALVELIEDETLRTDALAIEPDLATLALLTDTVDVVPAGDGLAVNTLAVEEAKAIGTDTFTVLENKGEITDRGWVLTLF